MTKKSELIHALFEMCYEYNDKAYILHKNSYENNDEDSEKEAIYYNGFADGAESILQKFNLMNDYQIYCEKRDRMK